MIVLHDWKLPTDPEMVLRREECFLCSFVLTRWEMVQPVLTKAVLQPAKTATISRYIMTMPTHLPLSHVFCYQVRGRIALTFPNFPSVEFGLWTKSVEDIWAQEGKERGEKGAAKEKKGREKIATEWITRPDSWWWSVSETCELTFLSPDTSLLVQISSSYQTNLCVGKEQHWKY